MSLIADFPHVTIRSVSVSQMDNNVYLLTAKDTGSQILIDAAAGLHKIEKMLAESHGDAAEPTRLDMVVTTHSHWDHVRALDELIGITAARTAAGAADAHDIESATGCRIDVELHDSDVVETHGLSLKVIGLRGHTPGSIALAYSEPGFPVQLFTGDSLFPGGVGNTNHVHERFESLYEDVVTRIFDVYGDDTVVHPGHGQPTTLGAERPHLAEWLERGW